MSSVVSLNACLQGRSRGGDMAGGEELSALMVGGARAGNRRRGERGSVEGLTAGSTVISACSGKA